MAIPVYTDPITAIVIRTFIAVTTHKAIEKLRPNDKKHFAVNRALVFNIHVIEWFPLDFI